MFDQQSQASYLLSGVGKVHCHCSSCRWLQASPPPQRDDSGTTEHRYIANVDVYTVAVERRKQIVGGHECALGKDLIYILGDRQGLYGGGRPQCAEAFTGILLCGDIGPVLAACEHYCCVGWGRLFSLDFLPEQAHVRPSV